MRHEPLKDLLGSLRRLAESEWAFERTPPSETSCCVCGTTDNLKHKDPELAGRVCWACHAKMEAIWR